MAVVLKYVYIYKDFKIIIGGWKGCASKNLIESGVEIKVYSSGGVESCIWNGCLAYPHTIREVTVVRKNVYKNVTSKT